MTTTQSTDEQSRDVLRTIYEAVATMDVPRFIDCCSEDLVLHSPAVGGTFEGRDAVLGCIGQLVSAYDWSTLKVQSLAADGERVAAQVSVEASGPDRTVVEIAEWWTVRDGKATECRPYYHDPAVAVSIFDGVLKENAAEASA